MDELRLADAQRAIARNGCCLCAAAVRSPTPVTITGLYGASAPNQPHVRIELVVRAAWRSQAGRQSCLAEPRGHKPPRLERRTAVMMVTTNRMPIDRAGLPENARSMTTAPRTTRSATETPSLRLRICEIK